MINIKDKLKVSNILIKRTNDVDVEYVPVEVFEADIKDINKRINEIDGADIDADNYVSKAEFNNEIDEIKNRIETIPEKKVDATGINFANSTFEELSDAFDFSNVTNFTKIFSYCKNLKKVNANLTGSMSKSHSKQGMFLYCSALETGASFYAMRVTDMSNMYEGCSEMTSCPAYEIFECASLGYMFKSCIKMETVGGFITVGGGDAPFLKSVSGMFYACGSLIKAPKIPTKNVEDFSKMFYSCDSLTDIPEYDASSATNVQNIFLLGGQNVTNFGGFKNLKVSWADDAGLAKCPNLTYESIMNVINGLYDLRGNGDMTPRTLKLHSNSLNKLSDDDKAIATAKGWIIST